MKKLVRWGEPERERAMPHLGAEVALGEVDPAGDVARHQPRPELDRGVHGGRGRHAAREARLLAERLLHVAAAHAVVIGRAPAHLPRELGADVVHAHAELHAVAEPHRADVGAAAPAAAVRAGVDELAGVADVHRVAAEQRVPGGECRDVVGRAVGEPAHQLPADAGVEAHAARARVARLHQRQGGAGLEPERRLRAHVVVERVVGIGRERRAVRERRVQGAVEAQVVLVLHHRHDAEKEVVERDAERGAVHDRAGARVVAREDALQVSEVDRELVPGERDRDVARG